MAILIETRLNALKLNESKQPRKGCLGHMEGICADFLHPTRNGRLYPQKLWENVFNTDLVKEGLQTKTLLGELDHPEERFEVLAKEACVVMTDYTIDEQNGVLYGGFDILDTPSGRILRSLLDYGCVMGVSSRGQGDIINTSEGETVDPDTYDFACFDVVTTPAVETARQAVTESVRKARNIKLMESIQTQIKEATTQSELNTIRRVVESTNLPNMEEINASIEDKCKSFAAEGTTVASQLTKDLQEAVQKIANLESKLKSGTTVAGVDVKQLCESNKVLRQEVVKLRKANRVLTKSNGSLQESVTTTKSDNQKLTEKLNSVVNDDTVERKLTESRERVKNLEFQIRVLQEANSSLVNENQLMRSQLEQLNVSEDENSSIVSQLSRSNSALTEELNKTKTVQQSNYRKVGQLKEEISKCKDIIRQYNNYSKRLQEAYLSSRAKALGVNIDVKSLLIGPNLTVSEMDKLLENTISAQDRFSKMSLNEGFIGTTVPTEQLKDTTLSAEERETQEFLERVQKQF